MSDFISKTKVSNCCGAPVYSDTDICTDCKEHCEIEEEKMERMIDLDQYNEKRSEIISQLSISKVWDCINQHYCPTPEANKRFEEELKEVLDDFIYNHDISLEELEEYL